MKKSLLIYFVCLFNLIHLKAATPWLHVEGNKIKDPAGNVVILRGVSLRDIYSLQQDTVVNLYALTDTLTDTDNSASNSPGWYTKVIRFPVYPDRIKSYDDYYNNTLKPAVDYATAKGLYVIIDYHHIADIEAHIEDTRMFWEYMAPKFRNYSNVLYEVYNEPINQSWTWGQFKPYMQQWVDVIRKYAPHNLILAGSPNWSQKMGDAATNPLSGNNIVYVAHIYPSHFATPWNISEVEKAAAVHPIFMTEWGFSGNLTDPTLKGTVSDYGAPIMQWADTWGMSWTAWCADNDWKPNMFSKDWKVLLGGNDEMGGFVKDTLYAKRDKNLPADITCLPPYLGIDQTICSDISPAISTGLSSDGKVFRWYKDGVLLNSETGPSVTSSITKGTYKVEIDSNGCTMSDELNVVDTLLGVSLISDRALRSPITLVAGGASVGYSYEWYKNGTKLSGETSNSLEVFDTCGTVYKVNVTYTGCNTVSDEFKILCVRGMYLGHRLAVPGIIQAEDFDFQNVPDTSYHDTDSGNQGGAYRPAEGVDVQACSEGGFNVGWTEAGEWFEYSIKVTDPGVCGVRFRVASKMSGGGSIRLELNKAVLDTIEIPNTGDWQKWQDVIINNVTFTDNDSILRIRIIKGGINLNYIQIQNGVIESVFASRSIKPLITLYPNPSSDIIYFSGSGNDYAWRICTSLGEEVLQGTGSHALVGGLSRGQYILLIEGEAYKFLKW